MVLFFFFTSCAHKNIYPSHWWQDPKDESKKSWEILPSQAAKGEVILSKRNELGLLSNFAATPIFFEGKSYASIEGLWQSLKYPESSKDQRFKLAQWPSKRQEVEAMIGFEAKHAGQFASRVMKKHGLDWVTYKGQKMTYRQKGESPFYKLIRKAIEAKVTQNPRVRETLLATGDLKLRPDHKQKIGSPKAWLYHKIYMEIRTQLQRK